MLGKGRLLLTISNIKLGALGFEPRANGDVSHTFPFFLFVWVGGKDLFNQPNSYKNEYVVINHG